jgi:hypothetical protein
MSWMRLHPIHLKHFKSLYNNVKVEFCHFQNAL